MTFLVRSHSQPADGAPDSPSQGLLSLLVPRASWDRAAPVANGCKWCDNQFIEAPHSSFSVLGRQPHQVRSPECACAQHHQDRHDDRCRPGVEGRSRAHEHAAHPICADGPGGPCPAASGRQLERGQQAQLKNRCMTTVIVATLGAKLCIEFARLTAVDVRCASEARV